MSQGSGGGLNYSFLMAVNKDNPYLDTAINSVCDQSDTDFEFMIVANNCDDALWEKLNKYDDSRIRLTRIRTGQLAYSLNVGLDSMDADYALRMDADDVCLPHRLRITKAALLDNDYPDILCGDAILIDGNGNVIGKTAVPRRHDNIVREFWKRNCIIHPASALRVSTVRALRGYCGGFVSEDLDLWMRASRMADVRFAGIGEPVIQYRIHGDQARGSSLAYAESAGYALREGLVQGQLKYLFGALLRVAKFYVKR